MAFNFDAHKDDLLFVPLGGSNEVGMNLNLYTLHGKWLMVDLGIGFPDGYLPGIEVMVPDISFIVERKKDLLGLVLTHAHEDHLGAVPYLWEELGCPIYATPFTTSLLRHKLREEGLANRVPLHDMRPGKSLTLGPFTLEMLPLTHSIPEMQAIAITTDKGVVMHTGDWKFDSAPMVGPVSDEAGLRRYGDGEVLAMVCDSTNVFVEGESGSEKDVRTHLTQLISECKGRVAVTTFASNLARLETIILAGREAGRHIGLAGRSLWRMVESARESGYLQAEQDFLGDREIMNLPRDDVLLICTGCQGEPRAALTRIARGEHQSLRFSAGDTVIFASRKIPGNETRINWVHNRLVERGIEVITDRNNFIHVSGHPARGELTRMYQLVRPKIAVPTHGEPRHLHEHALLARELQVPETVQASNGAVVLLAEGDAAVIGRVESGYVAVDGHSLIPANSSIFRERRRMRDEGIVFASLAVNAQGRLMGDPVISAPGALDPEDGEDMAVAAQCAEAVAKALGASRKTASDHDIAEVARGALRGMLTAALGKKPLISVHVVRV